MSSAAVYNAICDIAITSSTKEKAALLAKHIADPVFCRVVEYAYNPFKTYGITRSIGKTHPGYREFDDSTWAMLDAMISRELTGHEAQRQLDAQIDELEEGSAELLRRIINKNMRAGFSESSLNKAKKGLIPEFPYMRCSLPKDANFDAWPWETGVIVQEKADAMFANLDVELGGIVRLSSRQGSPFPMEAFQSFVNEVKARLERGYQYHGELMVYRDNQLLDRATGNGVLNSVLSGGSFAPSERPVYVMWDAVPLSCVVSKGQCDTPYATRLKTVATTLARAPVVGTPHLRVIPSKVIYSLGEAYAYAGKLMKEGKEGAIVCHPMEGWKDGTSKGKIKIKLEFNVDLRITGIVPGRPGTKNEGRPGSVTAESLDGDLVTDVTVKNEKMRASLEKDPDAWMGKIIEVVANDISEPCESNDKHSLFLPRMATDTWRTDKAEPDNLYRIYAAREAAILGQELKEAA